MQETSKHFLLAVETKLDDNEFIGRELMFSETDIFAFIKTRNRSKNSITIFFRTTSAKYPIKSYVPLCHVISANTNNKIDLSSKKQHFEGFLS
ncbi:MAG: hypothetical protein NT010_10895 [Proteobacteria bacterium]|nr:hypothetical protein [Pseudomonadota bacterium]